MSDAAVESQIAGFLARYTSAIEAQLRAARVLLRARFPQGFEMVYDNYNALVFAISPTGRASDIVLSVAGYPRWITLFFAQGASLPDPTHRLAGEGRQIRGIRLVSPVDIDAPDVDALITRATAPFEAAFRAAPGLTTVVQSVSAKQRPRRPR